MDSGVTRLRRDAVLRTNYQARRRRYNDVNWLIHQNRWIVLDEVADLVWRGCEASLTAEAIIRRLAETMDMPLAEALAATSHALGCFVELGLVSWDETPPD